MTGSTRDLGEEGSYKYMINIYKCLSRRLRSDLGEEEAARLVRALLLCDGIAAQQPRPNQSERPQPEQGCG